MTTYRKEPQHYQHHQLLKDTYSEVEYEGLAAKVNCLVGFTVISILIGAAGLAISVMLLIQNFDLVAQEQIDFEELHLRVKHLELLLDVQEPSPRRTLELTTRPPPAAGPEVLQGVMGGVRAGEATLAAPQNPPGSPHVTPDQPRQPETEVWAVTEPEVVVDDGGKSAIAHFPPTDDDDYHDYEMEGSGGCPLQPPRPVCPMGISICRTKGRCPVYVCCKV